MERKAQLEYITIATLVNDFDNVWPKVRTALYEGMFNDDFCRQAYNTMRRMASEGKKVDIATLHQEGLDAMKLYTTAADYDFPALKWLNDWGRRLAGKDDTNVKFMDYIKALSKYAAQRQKTTVRANSTAA